jgi:diaminopimelate decarboxylase
VSTAQAAPRQPTVPPESGQLTAARLSAVHRAARLYGTPAYVYDLAEVRSAHAELTALLPERSLLYYSVKANPHPVVCRELAGLGCGAEVSSAGEVQTCIAAGFPADRCLFTGPGKTPAEISQAIRDGIRDFSVESPADLRRVAAAAATAGTRLRCLLRVNLDTRVPGMGLTMTGVASQFGTDARQVLDRPGDFADDDYARLTGVHLFMGSNLADQDVLVRQFDVALQSVTGLESALGRPLPFIDLGGGFAAPFARPGGRPDYAGLRERLAELVARRLPGGQPRQLAFESGRYLVGGCGILVARVLDVKDSKGSTFVVLDSGINHLGGMAGLRRVPSARVEPLAARPATPADTSGEIPDCYFAGPLCTPLDTWARGVTAPPLRAGDLVTVPNVGGYGLTASLLAFLSRAAAVEVIVDGSEIRTADRLTLTRQAEHPRPAHPRAAHPRAAHPCPSGHRIVGSADSGDTAMLDPAFDQILRRHLKYLDPGDALDPDQPLRDLGLDSMQAVELLFDVEDRFDRVLDDEELTAETFATARSLWAVISGDGSGS